MSALDESAEAAYSAIRAAKQSDIASVAKSTGLSVKEVQTLKKHIFYGKHQLPTPDGSFIRSRFTAHDEIAHAWQKAQSGALDASQQKWFRQFADHELGERMLMGRGVPYRNPRSYNPSTEMWGSFPPGAHDLAVS